MLAHTVAAVHGAVRTHVGIRVEPLAAVGAGETPAMVLCNVGARDRVGHVDGLLALGAGVLGAEAGHGCTDLGAARAALLLGSCDGVDREAGRVGAGVDARGAGTRRVVLHAVDAVDRALVLAKGLTREALLAPAALEALGVNLLPIVVQKLARDCLVALGALVTSGLDALRTSN